MNSSISYNDSSIDASELNNIINKKIDINNIKLLETPIEIKSNNLEFTLLKIICNKKLKKFFKKIEKLYHNDNKDISIVFNYDDDKNCDYYELLLNKKIVQIIENFDIQQSYNIQVSLVNNDIVLWKIHSIEIADNYKIKNIEDDTNLVEEEDYEPDYQEIQNSYKNQINKLLKKNNEKLLILENQNLQLENLLNEILNNYNITKLEYYSEQLDAFLK